MADPLSIRGAGTPSSVERATGDASAPRSATSSGAAFRVLLEKLEDQAAGLQKTSERIEKPEELAEAMTLARESLAQAFELRDQLLEAWRASRQSGPRE
jgi:hypothetical protein